MLNNEKTIRFEDFAAVSQDGGYLYIKNSGTGKPIPLSEGKDLRHIKRDVKKNNCKELLLLKLFFYCCR